MIFLSWLFWSGLSAGFGCSGEYIILFPILNNEFFAAFFDNDFLFFSPPERTDHINGESDGNAAMPILFVQAQFLPRYGADLQFRYDCAGR